MGGDGKPQQVGNEYTEFEEKCPLRLIGSTTALDPGLPTLLVVLPTDKLLLKMAHKYVHLKVDAQENENASFDKIK